MDFKDFKLSIAGLKRTINFKVLVKKMFNERTSRPRVKKDIIRNGNI